MRNFLNSINNVPHAEERPNGRVSKHGRCRCSAPRQPGQCRKIAPDQRLFSFLAASLSPVVPQRPHLRCVRTPDGRRGPVDGAGPCSHRKCQLRARRSALPTRCVSSRRNRTRRRSAEWTGKRSFVLHVAHPSRRRRRRLLRTRSASRSRHSTRCTPPRIIAKTAPSCQWASLYCKRKLSRIFHVAASAANQQQKLP